MPAPTASLRRSRRLRCSAFIAFALTAFSLAGAQTISSTSAMSFGSFGGMPGWPGGTVVVAPNGSRTAPSGGVMLLGNAGISAATLTVAGTPGATYSISLPVNGAVFLSTAGGHSMAINAFASNPSATGTLFGSSQVLSVGATLALGSMQAPGDYSGNFNVTVNYP